LMHMYDMYEELRALKCELLKLLCTCYPTSRFAMFLHIIVDGLE
jgi:hypothetical protein